METPEDGFRRLYAAHVRAVLAYAVRRVAAEDAADIVAETFLIAWRRWDDVPLEALPWLYGVARRVLANQVRGEGRRNRLGEMQWLNGKRQLQVDWYRADARQGYVDDRAQDGGKPPTTIRVRGQEVTLFT